MGFVFVFVFNLLFINMFQKWVKTIIVNPSILSIITDLSKMNFKIETSVEKISTLYSSC